MIEIKVLLLKVVDVPVYRVIIHLMSIFLKRSSSSAVRDAVRRRRCERGDVRVLSLSVDTFTRSEPYQNLRHRCKRNYIITKSAVDGQVAHGASRRSLALTLFRVVNSFINDSINVNRVISYKTNKFL